MRYPDVGEIPDIKADIYLVDVCYFMDTVSDNSLTDELPDMSIELDIAWAYHSELWPCLAVLSQTKTEKFYIPAYSCSHKYQYMILKKWYWIFFSRQKWFHENQVFCVSYSVYKIREWGPRELYKQMTRWTWNENTGHKIVCSMDLSVKLLGPNLPHPMAVKPSTLKPLALSTSKCLLQVNIISWFTTAAKNKNTEMFKLPYKFKQQNLPVMLVSANTVLPPPPPERLNAAMACSDGHIWP